MGYFAVTVFHCISQSERQAILIFHIQNFPCLNDGISEIFPESDPASTFSPYYLPPDLKSIKKGTMAIYLLLSS